MSVTSNLPQSVNPPVMSAQPRVLFCLSDEEMGWFFPAFTRMSLGAQIHRFDTSGEPSEAQWRKALDSVRPHILVTCWSTHMLPEAYVRQPDLELGYVCHIPGSVRGVIPRSLLERGVLVSNWGSMAATGVAEHALLLILNALRRQPRWLGCLRAPYEEQTDFRIGMQTRTLVGQRVGLHGFGKVARHLVRFLEPFKVRLSAYSEGVPAAFMREHGVEPARSLEELFAENAIVVECEGLTAQTENSVTAGILGGMQADAVFVNVARGKLVDEEALMSLARAGAIRVALDVYREEPLPHDSPWLKLADTVLSPHIAGPTHDQFRLCGTLAEENIRRFLVGKPIEATVSLRDYDLST
ncbi:MAG: hydroxyacid dehydrogenase [Verrucomicrobiota bacterium JB024]|nr:hydroxyacid dehydrogenase [Verrucomicrobiota bacterium JB024]